MQIQKSNNSPVFTGYTGKSIKRLINVNATKECTAGAKFMRQCKEKPARFMDWMMSRFKKGIIYGLDGYMHKLEKKTYLRLVKGTENNYIALKNPITKKNFFIVQDKSGEITLSETPKHSIGRFSEDAPPFSILESIIEYMNYLSKMDPKKIDSFILESATNQEVPPAKNIFQKIKRTIMERKIFQYEMNIDR